MGHEVDRYHKSGHFFSFDHVSMYILGSIFSMI